MTTLLRQARRIARVRLRVGVAIYAAALAVASATAGDLSMTSLFDGERTGQLGLPHFLNNWGGPFSAGNLSSVTRDSGVAHSGAASIRANLGTIAPGGFGFFQTFASQPAAQNTRQTRDLTRYDSFEAYVRNDTGSPLNLKYEIKDYRDNGGHQAFFNFAVPAGAGWTKITAPLDLGAPGWTVVGSPDLSRTYVNSFVVTPQSGSISGSIYLDDFKLREAGPSIDPQTAPIEMIADRLAERQFSGLWTARNRATGLIYNSSDDAHAAAMNTTGGVLWMLPAAVRRGWVNQTDADAFAAQVVASLNTNRNLTAHVPTRFIVAATAGLSGSPNEESSIDASFMALALHHYKSQPTTAAPLATAIDAVQNRFELDAFAVPSGFRLAYLPGDGFTAGTYDGYTNEGKVISLAAEVSDDHRVPLADLWNSDAFRARDFLVNPDDAHLTHSFSQFRAPFEQALLNLFVDTSERGVDNYPDRTLATNPWQNFVRYERETAAKLDQLGRELFLQPDAGNGGDRDQGFGGYEQYSLYNNFGQPTLFMPWSVTLALLAGAQGAEEALRTLLDTDVLQGPLGLADSARWATGAAGPTNVPATQDNWNMVLSTMALLEFLEGGNSSSRFFADLPEVKGALDTVFLDGDLDGNGVTNAADLLIWRSGFGDLAGATPAGGDADGDGAVDGADILRWQRGLGSFTVASTVTGIPEPNPLIQGAFVAFIGACARRRRRKA
jgi:hypothetical protein